MTNHPAICVIFFKISKHSEPFPILLKIVSSIKLNKVEWVWLGRLTIYSATSYSWENVFKVTLALKLTGVNEASNIADIIFFVSSFQVENNENNFWTADFGFYWWMYNINFYWVICYGWSLSYWNIASERFSNFSSLKAFIATLFKYYPKRRSFFISSLLFVLALFTKLIK